MAHQFRKAASPPTAAGSKHGQVPQHSTPIFQIAGIANERPGMQ